ncbi:MAG TPA: Hsp20/alpha crystallin family protein [Azospirillum sp.]
MEPTARDVPIRREFEVEFEGGGDRTDVARESADAAAIGHTTPDADVIEYADAFEIVVELPGLTADEVAVTQAGGAVTVAAVKADPETTHCTALVRHLAERRYGLIRRAFPLPAGIEPDAIRACLENGVLTVVLPKTAGTARHA